MELLILPKPLHGCLCVCLQEFSLLPSPESPEALLPVEFDVADVVKPITEILTNVSRLLLEDLPRSLAPKAPDPTGQGNPSAHRVILNHSLAHATVLGTWLWGTGGWGGDTHLMFSSWVSVGWDELGGVPVASPCWQC